MKEPTKLSSEALATLLLLTLYQYRGKKTKPTFYNDLEALQENSAVRIQRLWRKFQQKNKKNKQRTLELMEENKEKTLELEEHTLKLLKRCESDYYDILEEFFKWDEATKQVVPVTVITPEYENLLVSALLDHGRTMDCKGNKQFIDLKDLVDGNKLKMQGVAKLIRKKETTWLERTKTVYSERFDDDVETLNSDDEDEEEILLLSNCNLDEYKSSISRLRTKKEVETYTVQFLAKFNLNCTTDEYSSKLIEILRLKKERLKSLQGGYKKPTIESVVQTIEGMTSYWDGYGQEVLDYYKTLPSHLQNNFQIAFVAAKKNPFVLDIRYMSAKTRDEVEQYMGINVL